MSLNKLVLVTGGARRIGAAIASKFAEQGYHVIISANTNMPLAQQLAADLMAKHTGVKVGVVKGNLAKGEEVTAVAQAIINHELTIECGGLDGLVHNASVYKAANFGDDQKEGLDALYEHTAVHLTGPYLLTQALLEPLKAKRGCIVALTDTSAGRSWPDLEHYTVTKAALRQLMMNLAGSLGKFGVRANCVAPGYILEAEDVNEDTEKLLARIPMQRMGSPNDIAGAVLYFMQASYCTGQTLAVDGGLSVSS